MHIHIPYRNLMIEICPTDFSGKRISRIIGNFKMPIDTSVVGINPAVMPLAEKTFTFGGIKVIVGRRFLQFSILLLKFTYFCGKLLPLFLFGFVGRQIHFTPCASLEIFVGAADVFSNGIHYKRQAVDVGQSCNLVEIDLHLIADVAVRFMRSLSSIVSAADNSLPKAASRMNAATDSRAALALFSIAIYSASLNCISFLLGASYFHAWFSSSATSFPLFVFVFITVKRVIAAAAACAYSGNFRLDD